MGQHLFSLQNNNNNNNNDNNNNNNNVNAANSNTNQANMNSVMAGRRRDLAPEESARAERVRRILSQHHRAAHSKRDAIGSLEGPSKKCVNFGNSFAVVMNGLSRTNKRPLSGTFPKSSRRQRSSRSIYFQSPR